MAHFFIGDLVDTEPLAVQATLTDRHFPHGADHARCALFAVNRKSEFAPSDLSNIDL